MDLVLEIIVYTRGLSPMIAHTCLNRLRVILKHRPKVERALHRRLKNDLGTLVPIFLLLELLVEFGILHQVLVFVHLFEVILELQILKFQISNFLYLNLEHLLHSWVNDGFARIRGLGSRILRFLIRFSIISLGLDGGERRLLVLKGLLLFNLVFEFLKFYLLFL